MVFEKFDPPSKHVAYPLQLWSGVWGYGGSSAGIDDGLSFQVGKIHLMGSLVAIVLWLYGYIVRKTDGHLNHLTIFAITGLFFSLFMILPPSRPIWDAFPVLAYIQFPWRFLTFSSLFSSVLAAFVIWKIFELLGLEKTKNKKQKAFLYLLFTLCSLLFTLYSVRFFQPKFKFPVIPAELITREKLVWSYSKISDEYLPKGFVVPISAEVAMRVDNRQNQLLVDSLKSENPVRRVANLISLFTIITFIIFIIFILFKKHGQNISG